MKKAIALVLVGLAAASCTQTEKGAGIGAVSGAIIGGAVTGNVRGAAVGAAIGGVSGAVIGSVADQPGQCYYRSRDRYDRQGRPLRYIDRCPRDYY
ncbi:YMGG-like glycine zipper-containing protein [Shinella sp.]|uniref:YMGG-like glycine zipper-containing protein n=1 Tax=Shinella sp. TaxID=1870904 RepID=UPI0039E5F787